MARVRIPTGDVQGQSGVRQPRKAFDDLRVVIAQRRWKTDHDVGNSVGLALLAQTDEVCEFLLVSGGHVVIHRRQPDYKGDSVWREDSSGGAWGKLDKATRTIRI